MLFIYSKHIDPNHRLGPIIVEKIEQKIEREKNFLLLTELRYDYGTTPYYFHRQVDAQREKLIYGTIRTAVPGYWKLVTLEQYSFSRGEKDPVAEKIHQERIRLIMAVKRKSLSSRNRWFFKINISLEKKDVQDAYKKKLEEFLEE